MLRSMRRHLWLLVVPLCLEAGPVTYDIVYVRAPRAGDNTYIRFPDVFFPTAMPSGSDLMLLHASGAEEVLFPAGKGAVLDPAVSLDGQCVFFSYIPDASTNGINPQRGLAYGGADIYKINIATRQVVRLTTQVWTPPTGSANWSSDPLSPSAPNTVYLGYGLFNLGACPLPNGKVMFVSSRDGYLPNKSYTTPNLRLYIMDDDGRNVEPVGHLNIGSALHPTVLMDGRVMFASFESQGVRDQRNWGLWAVWPDGRKWEPLMSAFTEGGAFHFQAQLSDGRIAVTQYYNLNDNGFGTILAFNSQKQPGTVPFGSPNAGDVSNPAVRWGLWDPGVATAGQPRYTSFPFSPPGLINLTGFSHGEDRASSTAQDGGYAGKATHPAAAPNDDLLLVWSPGPDNNLNRPTPTPYYDAGIYVLKGGQEVDDYRNLVKIKNDPNYNELQPKAVVPYSAIYGIAQPAALPFLPNDGSLSAMLPPGTPFGLIGTSSFYNRNTTPGLGNSLYNGLDSFNTSQNGESSNWFEQGADAGNYTNNDIYAVRIVALEGASHRSYPSGDDVGFNNFSNRERLRILGEIPLRKPGAGGSTVLDPQGNPDTSFLAKVPADTPFSFQTLDKNGLVLNMAQTWHMVRPGEVRNDCGGCHAHNRLPVDFASTAAAQASYQVADLTTQTPLLTKDASGNTTVKNAGRLVVDVEFYKDIKPILQRSCVQCHSKSGMAAAGLVLDDTTLANGYDNTYNRLANDSSAQWGIPPVISNHQWRQTNASRYIRMFQSRRSLLVWKVFGQRLDGWTNTDHPTESTPGVASTLPQGTDPNQADIDYIGTIMPPPGFGIAPLSEDDKMTIARWIDLGAPITAQGDPSYKGYFADEIKPTLTVSSPRSGISAGALTTIRIGMFDAYSGIDPASLSVIANFPVNGKPAGAELGPSFSQSNPSVWTLNLTNPTTSLPAGHLTVKVKDLAGNSSIVDRTFTIGAATTMALSRAALNFGVSGSLVTSSQSVTLTFSGASGTSWTASSNSSNVTVSPASGAGNVVLQVTASPGATGVITVTAPNAINSPQQIQVKVATATPGNPFGSFDTPADNITGVTGAVAVTGWALDTIEVAKVEIWREKTTSEPATSNGLVYIGDAVFVPGARPDVESTFPSAPLNYRGGWGYMMLTNMLPNNGGAAGPGNGTYKLHAIAHSTAGAAFDLGTKTITVDNSHAAKPFGTIDTPSQGGTASGNAFANFGWALTQNPNVIPADGSSITVLVDGVTLGHPTYNQFRPDIANLFPGLANSNGAIGFFFIDTTMLSNGIHTISWVAYDNAGHGEGLGSRYFNVFNAGGTNTGGTAAPAEPPTHIATVRNREALHAVSVEELDRIELNVGATAGSLVVRGERRPLPIGSSLHGGVFRWQLGPGFLGEYNFEFEVPNAEPLRERVTVHPKSY